jgi:hypothetical protein
MTTLAKRERAATPVRIRDTAHYELMNWSRACWSGEYPGPKNPTCCRSLENLYQAPHYVPEDGEEFQRSEDEACANLPDPDRTPINFTRARTVQDLYEAWPLIEQRVIQQEYTRRHEYGDMRPHERAAAACRKLGIAEAYYKIALGAAREQVRRAFE